MRTRIRDEQNYETMAEAEQAESSEKMQQPEQDPAPVLDNVIEGEDSHGDGGVERVEKKYHSGGETAPSEGMEEGGAKKEKPPAPLGPDGLPLSKNAQKRLIKAERVK